MCVCERERWEERAQTVFSLLIEDFLTECSKYKHIRDAYFKQIALVSPEFQQTSNTEKLWYILGEKEKCIQL